MTPNNYSYNRDEQYCYPPDYRVLINRFDIRKQEALDEIEREIAGLKLLEIQACPIPGSFDLQHLKVIHRHLFQEIYTWAGEVRKGSFLQKGETLFCLGQHIESFAAEIHRQLKAEI
jgi:cell filamentation protein